MILPVISNSQCWWKMWSWYSKDKQWTLNICSNLVNLLVSANKDSPIATNPSPQTVVQHGTLYQPSKRSKMNQPLPSSHLRSSGSLSTFLTMTISFPLRTLAGCTWSKPTNTKFWTAGASIIICNPKATFQGAPKHFQHEWHIYMLRHF